MFFLMRLLIRNSFLYVVVLTLIYFLSKMVFLVAMVLPWKILSISYIDKKDYKGDITHAFFNDDSTLWVLVIGVFFFYLIYVLLEFIYNKILIKAAARLISSTNFTGFFSGYLKYSESIYKAIFSILVNSIFILSSLLFFLLFSMYVFYFVFFLLFLSFSFFVFVFLFLERLGH